MVLVGQVWDANQPSLKAGRGEVNASQPCERRLQGNQKLLEVYGCHSGLISGIHKDRHLESARLKKEMPDAKGD